ncbi:MAG: nitrogenase component 1 [Eubacteriaceae bacterium]|nr:nitrogenase component 1 [Eubacteriaceae bacterium]
MNPELGHLKKLSTIRSGKNIKFLTPAVYSGGWCPMRVACNICEDIEGMSYLLVGMPECATHSRGMNSMPVGPNGELRWLYVLDANEVIFGCQSGVIDALRKMDKEGARAILMIASCVTDLIGEDFEGIISAVQPELNARLSYVTLGQFKNFSSAIGTWKTAEALASVMSRQETDPNEANALFIEPWRYTKDAIEFPLIVRSLEKKGVKVTKIAAGATLDDYISAPSAALNLVLCSYTQPLAEKMQSSFGVPYAPLHNVFKVEDIDRVYDEVAKQFSISWDGEFSLWRERALELEERAAKELPGLKYVFLTGVDMPAALSVYLAGFGMEPLLMHIGDFHNEDLGYAKQLKAYGYDPPICRLMHRDHDIDIIAHKIRPDISFGSIRDEIEGFKVAEEMGDFFGMVGYERTVGILSRIFTVLETGKTGRRVDKYGLVSV